MASTADKTFQVKFVSAIEQFEGSGYESFDFTPAEKSKGTGIDWADLDDGSSFTGDAGETTPAAGHIEVAFEGPTVADGPDDGANGNVLHLDASAIATTQILSDSDDTFHYDGKSSVSIEAANGTDTIALDGASANYLIHFYQRGFADGSIETALVIFDIETGHRIVGRGVEKLAFSDGLIDVPLDLSALPGWVLRAHPETGAYSDMSSSHLVSNMTLDEHGQSVAGSFGSVDWTAGTIADWTGSGAMLGTDHADLMSDTPEADIIAAGAGNDIIVASTAGSEVESDNLFGGAGNDSFYLGTGSANVEGGEGDDTVYLDQGFVSVWGGQGHDTLSLNVSADAVLLVCDGNPFKDGFSIHNGNGDYLANALAVETLSFIEGVTAQVPDTYLGPGYYGLVQSGTDWKLALLHGADWHPDELLTH